jgi:tetratricopeptide (TPR) repeat protein
LTSSRRVTPDNAPDIASICVRLDGLPLAIELAAARIKLFTPQALLGRLSNRLKILTGGAKDLPARQQTLRGAIEWSYELLSEEEKQLFRRLAVFNGGRTLEAIERVCNSESLQVNDWGWGSLQIDVMDGTQSLLDKSLLVEREGHNKEPRYWMLETIQEYAWEKLRESGEAAVLQREHALYFMALVEEAEPHLTGERQQEWVDRLADEYDNIRAALDWANQQSKLDASNTQTAEEAGEGAAEIGFRIAGALWRFWAVKGLFTEGREHLRRLLELTEAEATAQGHPLSASKSRSRAKALNGVGVLAWRQGDYSSAQSLQTAALELGGEIGDKQIMAFSLNGLGSVAKEQGDSAAARSLYEESLSLRREIGDKRGIAVSLNNLGNVASDQGDSAAARSQYEECLVLMREIGDKRGIANTLINLGDMAMEQGEYTAARSLLVESLVLMRELGDKWGIATSLAGLGGVAIRGAGRVGQGPEGEVERGARLLGAAEGLLQSMGAVLEHEEREPYEWSVQQARSLLGEEAFEKERQEGWAMSIEEATEYALQPAVDEPARAQSVKSGQTGQFGRSDEERLERQERQRQVEEQLHIKIDQERKARQVEAIIGTEYFVDLQARASALLLERKEREASGHGRQ